MNVVQCSNGHFFDNDMFSACPHCGAVVGGNSQRPIQGEVKEKKHGLFGRKEKDNGTVSPNTFEYQQNSVSQSTPLQSNIRTNDFNRFDTPTIDTPMSNAATIGNSKKEVTLDFWQSVSTPQPINDSPMTPVVNSDSMMVERENDMDEITDTYADSNPVKESIAEQIRNASSMSEGKTMSYFSVVNGESKGNIPEKKPEQIDPVVGWLVCIKGEHFGESFVICVGMNSVGRSEKNRIVVKRDPSISREKHAIITYEPKHHQFYIKPGDSSGLTYVNEEYITETKHLVAKDVLELGNSKFMLIPLCGEDFFWESYINEQ